MVLMEIWKWFRSLLSLRFLAITTLCSLFVITGLFTWLSFSSTNTQVTKKVKATTYGCVAPDTIITTNTTWPSSSCSSNVTITNGATLTIAGNTSHQIDTLTLGGGSTNGYVVVNSDTTLGVGSEIQANNITINPGSYISANGTGYAPMQGSGAGRQWGGASHGGQGQPGGYVGAPGSSWSPTYGSVTEPITLGSGGYIVTGGGAIKLSIAGNFINNGYVSADGTYSGSGSSQGAGAGGSIWINFTGANSNLNGSGYVAARGGSSGYLNFSNGISFYGGGGGHVSITGYKTNTLTGYITAAGQAGGGAGTVYTRSSGQTNGNLLISNKRNATDSTFHYAAHTPISEDISLANLQINSDSSAIFSGNTRVYETTTNNGTITLTGTHKQYLANTIVGSTGTITTAANTSEHTNSINIEADSLSIATGGKITGNGLGFAGGTTTQNGFGPGAGIGANSGGAGGAGYGGIGANGTGANGGSTYGDSTNPTDLGSGGGGGQSGAGGAGGGLIKIQVNGDLNVAGSITANGTNGASTGGGGSGGTINIHSTKFTCPNGSITANAGAGGTSGGQGSGGRIAIESEEYTACATLTANGFQQGTANNNTSIATPSGLTASVVTHNSIVWTWTDTSASETEFRLYDEQGNVRLTKTSTTSTQYGVLVGATETGLSPNMVYNRRVASVIDGQEGPKSQNVMVQTLAVTPATPRASVLSPYSLNVGLNPDINPAQTQYLWHETTMNKYLNPDGSFSDEPSWHTKDEYNGVDGVTIESLTPNTSYSFRVKARNDGYTETTYRTITTATYATTPPPPIIDPYASTITTTGSGSGWAYLCGTNEYLQANGTCGSTIYWHPTPTVQVGNLEPSTTYTFEVITRNIEGVETSYSEPVTVTTFAQIPNSPTVVVVSPTQARITITQDDNPSHTAYAIREYSTGGYLQGNGTMGFSPAWHTRSQWGGDNGYPANGLSANSTYSFALVARNSSGILTEYTDSVDALMPVAKPGAPNATNVARTTLNIALNSGYNSESTLFNININGRYVQQNGTLDTNPIWQTREQWGNTLGIQVTGLTPNTTYTINSTAQDVHGGENKTSDSIQVTTLTLAPDAPLLTVLSPSSINAVIAPDENSLDTTYSIKETTSDRYVQQNGTLDTNPIWQTREQWGNTLGIQVTGLTPNTLYEFQTQHKTSSEILGLLSYTAQARTTAATPQAPTLETLSSSAVKLSLDSDTNPNTVTYAIRFALQNIYLHSDGVLRSQPQWLTKSQINNNGGITLNGLGANTTYNFDVKARNSNNTETPYGPSTHVTTHAATPGPVDATNITSTSFNVTLTTDLNPIGTLYTIKLNTENIDLNGDIVATPQWHTRNEWNEANLHLTNLSASTTYNISVKAKSSNEIETGPTARSVITLGVAPGTPELINLTNTQATITFSPYNNHADTLYEIYLTSLDKYVQADNTLGDSPVGRTYNQWNGSAININGLIPNTPYELTINSIYGNSAPLQFTTLEVAPVTTTTTTTTTTPPTTYPATTTTTTTTPIAPLDTTTTTTTTTTAPIITTPPTTYPATTTTKAQTQVEGETITNESPPIDSDDDTGVTIEGLFAATGAWLLKNLIFISILLALGLTIYIVSKLKRKAN